MATGDGDGDPCEIVPCLDQSTRRIPFAIDAVDESAALFVIVDTASLIASGELSEDCSGLTFTDDDGLTILPHYIEGGCGSTRTRIWFEPSEAQSAGYIYVRDVVSPLRLEFEGEFLAYSESDLEADTPIVCPEGSQKDEEIADRFLRGGSVYGAKGGDETHGHSVPETLTGIASSSTSASPGAALAAPGAHVHFAAGSASEESHIPSYVALPICRSNEFHFAGLLFHTELPGPGASAVEGLDNRYMRASVGTSTSTGGAQSHTHTLHISTGQLAQIGDGVALLAPNPTVSADVHTHQGEILSDASPNRPPALVLTPVLVKNPDERIGTLVLAATELPPLGFRVREDLDGRFILNGSVGGSVTGANEHVHSFSGVVGASVTPGHAAGLGAGTAVSTVSHTHTVAGSTAAGTTLPPYFDVLFIERSDPNASVVIGQPELL